METDSMEQDTNGGDIDGFEAKFLEQFSSLGTTDREVLMAEFQRLLGKGIKTSECEFFLDMNNWNLQAAICSYLDYGQPSQPQCSISEVISNSDVTAAPNSKHTKSYWIKNTGPEKWAPGCSLKYVRGHQITATDRILVDALLPLQTVCMSLELVAPSQPGNYECQMQMCTATGSYFGDAVNISLVVSMEDVTVLSHQLSQMSPGHDNCLLSNQQQQQNIHNMLPSNQYQSMNCDQTSCQLQNNQFSQCSPLNNQDSTPNLLPMTACVQTLPVTSMNSMATTDNDMVLSQGSREDSYRHILDRII